MAPQNKQKVAFTSSEIRHFYTAKNNGNEKILTDIIKFISIFKNITLLCLVSF